MEFVNLDMDCIIHWLDFWKRWVAERESFFILEFTYEYKLINISPLFSFADTKRGNVTTISKDKVKNRHSTSTHDWNSFLKNYWILDANRPKTSANTNYFIQNGYIPISPLSTTFKHGTMLCSIFLCFIRREFDIFASYGSTF